MFNMFAVERMAIFALNIMHYDPGWFFRISRVVTLVGGTMFLMWLGEQITARGVGKGTSRIIIVAGLPHALATTVGTCDGCDPP